MNRMLLLFLLTGLSAVAQENNKTSYALHRYMLMIDAALHENLQLVPAAIRGINMQTKNPEATLLMDSTFNIIRQRINDETDVEILPVNTLEGIVQYSKMGYPIAGAKKTAKASDRKHFIEVNVEVQPHGSSTGTSTLAKEDLGGAEVSAQSVRTNHYPVIKVNLKLSDENGKKVKTYQGVYKSKEGLRSEVEGIHADFGGLSVFFDINSDIAVLPYYEFLFYAVSDLVYQVKANP